MQSSGTRYILQGRLSAAGLLATPLPDVDLVAEAVTRHSAVYLDTFDWRLYEEDREIAVELGRQTTNISLRDRRRRRELLSASGKRQPRFASDLPKGRLRDALTSIAGVRALLPIVHISYSERLVKALNADRKTVTRLRVLFQSRASGQEGDRKRALPDLVEVIPVLGYERETRLLCSALEDAGLKEVDDDLLHMALAAVGREPLDYSSRPSIILDRGMTMDEALRTVLINLARAMRANEPGMLSDVDIEFLHDYRVANRRTRSVISQFKKGISVTVLRSFRPGFKWLGKVTGPTRDADVYLENVDGYRANLPDEVAEQLLPLREFLRRKREREFKLMLRSLKTKRYQQLLAHWESMLLGTDSGSPVHLHRPVPALPVVSARIWKVYERIVKQGRAITAGTPATALHNLRLVCKNLRYLLEIFRSLYPADAIALLISELKTLQNNLGDIQDLEVQRLALEGFAQEMLEEGPVASGTVMAMGRLAASLEERQHAARADFAKILRRFAREKNRRICRELFRDQR